MVKNVNRTARLQWKVDKSTARKMIIKVRRKCETKYEKGKGRRGKRRRSRRRRRRKRRRRKRVRKV